MPTSTRENRRAGNIFDSSAMATPSIVTEVVQKHERLLHTERSPAVPVLDPYRDPLPQFVGFIDVRRGENSLECQVFETIERSWPAASRSPLIGQLLELEGANKRNDSRLGRSTIRANGNEAETQGKERTWKGNGVYPPQ
jgi:hypothetical protein